MKPKFQLGDIVSFNSFEPFDELSEQFLVCGFLFPKNVICLVIDQQRISKQIILDESLLELVSQS